MSYINKKFSLPKDQQEFKNVMKHINECDILSSNIYEDLQGPEIEEVYRCQCGNILLKQKSIITNIDSPEKDSIEMVHMESKECAL